MLDSPVFLALLVLAATWRLYAALRRKSLVEYIPVPVSVSHSPASLDPCPLTPPFILRTGRCRIPLGP